MTNSYFIAMINYGRRGRESVVNPEHTRQNIIDMVRAGEWDRDSILFIHEVTNEGGQLSVEDVTAEILEAAHVVPDDYRTTMTGEDRAAWEADRRRALEMAE